MHKVVVEQIVSGADSFVGYIREAEQFPLAWHCHSEYELVAILAGEGERFVGDHLDLYRVGDLILTGPGLPHAWASNPESQDNRAVVIQFSHDFLGPAFLDKPELVHVRQLLVESRRGLLFTGKTRNLALKRLGELIKSEGLPRVIKLLELLELLATMKTDRQELSSQLFDSVRHDASQTQFTKAFATIAKNYQNPLRPAVVAASVNMTAKTFNRMFIRHCGKSFTRMLIGYRVAMACLLLQETNLQVTEIATRCGFHNLANFNRQFLKLKHVSPRAYRQRWT
jgi:AraC-like DNA-binding protein/quercetin dioxygenase-like cupin family protein